MKRVLKWSALSLAALLVLVGGIASWLLFTTPGARWVAGWSRRASRRRVDTRASTARSQASSWSRFRVRGGADKARIRIRSDGVDPTLMMLFSRALRIDNALVRD
jgi:autotransporter translocation and assembly factor TamB